MSLLLKRLALWACCALALALAAPQTADAGWKLDRARQVANAVFPNPCGAHVRVKWWDHLPLDTWDKDVVAWTQPEYDTCEVMFLSNRHWSWIDLCTTMVHEYGHLAGLHHSSDPQDIMYEAPDWTLDCYDRGRAILGMKVLGYWTH